VGGEKAVNAEHGFFGYHGFAFSLPPGDFVPSRKVSNLPRILLVLGLAALGQLFLAQTGEAWTLWPGLLFYGAALWKARPLFSISPLKQDPTPTLAPRTEILSFVSIMFLGLFLRVFRLDSLPSGMHTDQGLMGISALKIAFEGWRPFFEVFNYHVPEVGMYYQLACWFKLLGSSYFTFHLFFALFALAAFPLVYWTFRQLSGPRVALLALFILAVMRWHLIFSRNGFPTIQVPFYMFGTLAFWLFWLRRGKPWALAVSALFCGVGLYTYQSFKAVPFLMLILAVYEYFLRREETKITREHILAFFLMVELVAAPFIWYMVKQGSFGNRERTLFILNEVEEKKSLAPVLNDWFGTALMFNREGDANARHNIPGHRMLDDVTGVFFVLGLAYAFYRRRERGGFYALSGFFVMSLPCLLSTDAAHANRMLAVTPFVAFFAASALDFLGNRAQSFLKNRRAVPAALGILLAALAAQNAYTYFVEQASNDECWRGYGVEQTYIGKKMGQLEEKQPGHFNYFLTTAYDGNHTIAYLGYAARNRTFPLLLRQMMGKNGLPSDRDAVFVLEEGKTGVFDFLKALFPGGHEERCLDKNRHTLVYWYEVPAVALRFFRGWPQGIQGTYINSLEWSGVPVAVRWDPVLNFTHKFDFPFTDYPPFSVLWNGRLNTPASGLYQFQILTSDWAELEIDGRKIGESPTGEPGKLELSKGTHRILVRYRKKDGDAMALHLIWKKPGEERWEVVPAAAFGKINVN
jgi:4-amino-4-deoxy-L-arabinose transferase-like glycosyltransferase